MSFIFHITQSKDRQTVTGICVLHCVTLMTNWWIIDRYCFLMSVTNNGSIWKAYQLHKGKATPRHRLKTYQRYDRHNTRYNCVIRYVQFLIHKMNEKQWKWVFFIISNLLINCHLKPISKTWTNVQEARRQVVNPQHQTPQRQSVAKAGTPL